MGAQSAASRIGAYGIFVAFCSRGFELVDGIDELMEELHSLFLTPDGLHMDTQRALQEVAS